MASHSARFGGPRRRRPGECDPGLLNLFGNVLKFLPIGILIP